MPILIPSPGLPRYDGQGWCRSGYWAEVCVVVVFVICTATYPSEECGRVPLYQAGLRLSGWPGLLPPPSPETSEPKTRSGQPRSFPVLTSTRDRCGASGI